ncbi:hypothetical protein EV182_001366 [Spiromyces aspiralis]|uniref:Uncharacterized protein n=1 Tax=Spiromyces aspiralis TaxID=68401 RepID=A0ACC1HFQ1_9FUNG|nr:hypothetical protein EV182_001366 [Spiromyces aspiralis]
MYWGRFTERGETFDSAVGILEARVTGSEIRIGSSSWSESIKENYLLVDKSFILPRVIMNDDPILVTRPRRFGKTMCLSMFEDFFGVPRGETLEEKKARYKDTIVGTIPGFIDKHCGQYPDVQSPDKAGFHRKLFDVLKRLLRCFPEIDEDVRKKVGKEEADRKAKKEVEKEVGKKDDEEVDEKTKADNRIRLLSDLKDELDWDRTHMRTDILSCIKLLMSLVQFLNVYHDKKCILLVDEFDAPILDASEDIRGTIRKHIRLMLAPLVKSGTENKLLSKCIMVGINPVSLGEVNSGLNNVTLLPLHYASGNPYPDDILKSKFSPYQIAFGFTEDEVRKLIATHVFPDNETMVEVALDVARRWYDGYYVFKDFRIYNPWSVMRFIEALTEDKTCSNEAEVLAKAKTYWIKTGSAKSLKEMYEKLNKIEPSTSRVIHRMCLDYFNLRDEGLNLENTDTSLEDEDSTESSVFPKTSIQVKLIESFDKDTIQEDTPQCFDEDTNVITVYIAEDNWESPTEHPTLNEFMTMAYYYGYLTIIGEEYLAIPNWETLAFWIGLIIDKPNGPGESPLLRSSRRLTKSLMSGDLDGFCNGLEQHFLDHMVKVDIANREYYYHEILYFQFRLGIDPKKYECRAEVSTSAGRADICLIPKDKRDTGFLIEVKRTKMDGTIDGICSCECCCCAGADPELQTDAGVAATATTTNTATDTADSRDDDGTVVDLTKQPYPHLKACLKVGIRQIEVKKYLQPFNDKCSKVLATVPAFCGRDYLVCFKNFRYDESKAKWVQSADQPSYKHKTSMSLPDAMAPAKRSTEDSSTGERSSKKAKGKGKRGGGN